MRTRFNVFPLKLYEYLAAGKPVVAVGLPELAGLEPDVQLARGLEAVEAAITRLLALRDEHDVERRRALAARNTWDVRAERLLALVQSELDEDCGSARLERRR